MNGGRAGFITLPTALLTVLAMVIVVSGGYALLRVVVRESVYRARSAQARAIAEAGLEDALNKITLSPTWKTGYSRKNFAGGYYSVSISTDQDPWVTSRGYSAPIAGFGRAVHTVKARALFDGIYNFSDSTITVNWAMTAFDSLVDRSPTCKTTSLSSSGCKLGSHVWGNTSVATAAGAVRVNGDASYALASSTPPAASTIAGKVSLAQSSVSVPVEDGAPFADVNDNNATRISPFSAYNPATKVLTVSAGNVTLSSGTFYFKGIVVSSKTLYIDLATPDQVAKIYLAGSLYVSPQGSIDSTRNCTANGGGCRACNVHFYGQGGGTITVSGYTSVGNVANVTYIDVFSPQDNVIINQRTLGRVVGRSVTIQNPYGAGNNRPVFFFDLQCGYASAKGTRWVRGSWSESYFKK